MADTLHRAFLPKPRLQDLIDLLLEGGFEVIGPRIEQGAIVYAPLRFATELPIGWTDRQMPGSYRLEQRSDAAYFGYAVGPHSWKRFLFPPTLTLWRARRTDDSFEVQPPDYDPPWRALLGVRACELHAIAVQDLAFMNRSENFTDPFYAKARERLFLVAVECEHPGGACFCASMGTGPELRNAEGGRHNAEGGGLATESLETTQNAKRQRQSSQFTPGFDLGLTELDDGFVVQVGSPAGKNVLERLQLEVATAAQVTEARRRVEQAKGSMGRNLDVTGIRELLHRNQEHPRWDEVANRCLSCTNCTLVCPTCFCSSVTDVTDLSQENAQRVRSWDSCFSPQFAQVHGGDFRPTIRSRYRQWLTHKFASWFDQFGVSGCVGCGRCITWCPVGIDVTEEIKAIRSTDGHRDGGTPT